MKVTVIGPGAIGCLFAARMAVSGLDVTLVDYRPDRMATLLSDGLTVETDGKEIKSRVSVVSTVPTRQDLVIVAVKAYSTKGLALPLDVPVLSLQNGLGNIETLCSTVGSSNVLAGINCEGVTSLGIGHVRHVATGPIQIGSWTSCPVDNAIDALLQAGFEAEVTNAPGQRVWEKAAINAGINPLTALLGITNGELLERKEGHKLLRDLVVEAAKVASTEGYRFEHSLVEEAEAVCRNTADNASSMLQDIRAGRRTEIDAISGEILRRGQMASLPTPRTRVVWQLIKSLERS